MGAVGNLAFRCPTRHSSRGPADSGGRRRVLPIGDRPMPPRPKARRGPDRGPVALRTPARDPATERAWGHGQGDRSTTGDRHRHRPQTCAKTSRETSGAESRRRGDPEDL
jgi:hypothetical protein